MANSIIIDPLRQQITAASLPLKPALIAAEEPVYKQELQSFVVGSQVLSFVDGVAAEHREAINNCCLLAHLYTNKQIGSAFGQMSEEDGGRVLFNWYNFYFKFLLELGWLPQMQEFKIHEAGAVGANVHEALIELATTFLGNVPGAFEVIKGVLTALSKVDDGPWITLFNQETHMQYAARFQVGLVQPNDAGGFLVSNLAFFVNAKTEVTQVLFFKWKDEGATLWTCGGNLTINRAAIDTIRDAVRTKVSDYAAAFIKNIAKIEL